jgi:lipopolysaccharide export system protein LptC
MLHTHPTALQSLGHFVRPRLFGWGFVGVLAVVAYFSTRLALDAQYKTPRSVAAAGSRHAPDFTAKQFTLWRSSLDGATQYQLQAQSMVHYRDDLSSELVNPTMVAKTQPGGAAAVASAARAGLPPPKPVETVIIAGKGLVRNDGELIEFTEAVKVQRSAGNVPLSTLETASLVLLPDSDWVVTRSPVTMTQGKNSSTAQGGIEYSHSDAQLQLKGPVQMVFYPK